VPKASRDRSLGTLAQNMKPICLFLALLGATICVWADSPSPNPFGYTSDIQGDRISFAEIQKHHLGKKIVVYMKPGFPNMFVGGPLPNGALLTDPETKNRMWIGELYSISSDLIRLRWYYASDRSSSTEYGAMGNEIDYIVVETKPK